MRKLLRASRVTMITYVPKTWVEQTAALHLVDLRQPGESRPHTTIGAGRLTKAGQTPLKHYAVRAGAEGLW